MTGEGSCNLREFAVPPGLRYYYMVGGESTDVEARPVNRRNVYARTPVLFQPAEPGIVAWVHEIDGAPEPSIWCVADGTNVPRYWWEGDKPPEGLDPAENEWRGNTIVQGGQAFRCAMPSRSQIEGIEAAVAAASIPSWVSGTWLESVASPDALCGVLWREMLALRQLPSGDYPDVLDGNHSAETLDLFILLRLRAASMVLYGHGGRTAIPLLAARATAADASTGLLTIS